MTFWTEVYEQPAGLDRLMVAEGSRAAREAASVLPWIEPGERCRRHHRVERLGWAGPVLERPGEGKPREVPPRERGELLPTA